MSFFDHSTLLGAACLAAGTGAGYWLVRWKDRNIRKAFAIRQQAELEAARREAENIGREARLRANEEALRLREETERSLTGRAQAVDQMEKRLIEREALISHQLETMVRQEGALAEQQQGCTRRLEGIEAQREELAALARQRRCALEEMARLSTPDARALLLKEVEMETLQDASNLTRRLLEEARARAEDKARRVISLAIQRYSGIHTFETTSSTVTLPNEELKGRIIGREGRNIRAFENATGVTVLIDDTPNAVVLSAFDPVRREIARESMNRLLLDGRIHPTRIEEVVEKVTREIDEAILQHGEVAVREAGVGPMHPEVIKFLGRLHYRHSFSQNVLAHSVEVAHLTGLMAAELGVDAAAARRAGLLHDIGKAVTQEMEGPHALVGADFLRRFGEAEEIVNAVASHHDEAPHHGPLGILVSAADAISASRPGARSETMTTYIKRVEDLERIGCSFPGVEKCFAVQAGRELRVLVQPEAVNDEQAFALARSIARKIEEDLHYPGQIRVVVVRERRCIEFAK